MEPIADPVAQHNIPFFHKNTLDLGIKLTGSTVAWEQAVEQQLVYVHDAWKASQQLEMLLENYAFDLYEKGEEAEQTLIQAKQKLDTAITVRNENFPIFAKECFTTHQAVIGRVRDYLQRCEKINEKYLVQHEQYMSFYKLNRKMVRVLAQAFAVGLIEKRFD